ncbi:molecular chaperone [Arthrobacter psychrolactophilus]|uniref:Molecular chaperone n=1 Tax=Arthrobacter psychrolactophilus TaxID=92442 RepID=A0A2V5J001_9MICC|nr:polyphosphate polymerase domain-containing protein [Arthrobacter psychrolactophilus]PYI40054.1 molecular chaperone [Arthrobacter psychrolactophilus]
MTLSYQSTLSPRLRELPTISLEELNTTAALQTRIDRKYLVPTEHFTQIFNSFDAEMHVLDTDGLQIFPYDSVYFDTPELDSYHLAAFGRRRRYKIRTRSYLNSGVSFLEVKTEGARSATVKERIPYELANRSTITQEGAAYITETLLSTGQAPPRGLSPVLETTYGRITLFLPASNSRATIDVEVAWSLLGQPPLIMNDQLVVETKSGSAPGQLDKYLWHHGIRPSRISKFATGMALLMPHLPANRWHRTLSHNMPQPPTP